MHIHLRGGDRNWLWKLRSPIICHLSAGEPGKPLCNSSQVWGLEKRGTSGVTQSLRPKNLGFWSPKSEDGRPSSKRKRVRGSRWRHSRILCSPPPQTHWIRSYVQAGRREATTPFHHKPQPWRGEPQSGENSKPGASPSREKSWNPTSGNPAFRTWTWGTIPPKHLP